MEENIRKSVTLEEAIDLLEDCMAVVVVEWSSGLCYPRVWAGNTENPDEFMELKCENEEGLVWEASFLRIENQQVSIKGNCMSLKASNDEDLLTLMLLEPMNLEESLRKRIPWA